MTIDHIGAILYPEYIVLRIVGRLALPIFCYLLTLGAKSTRNAKYYFIRLFSFALISQIPYYLAFGYQPFESPNILFTLSLGVIILQNLMVLGIPIVIASSILYILHFDLGLYEIITILCMNILNNDERLGVALLVFFNFFYAIIGAPIQIFALATLPIILYYKKMGKVNRNSVYPKWKQYFFYIYYPLSLSLLYLIKTSIH